MKYIVLFLTVFLIFTGCGDKAKISKLEKENTTLEKKYDSLRHAASLKDEFIQEYTQTINEVYDNLERIRKREQLFTKLSKTQEKIQNASLREKIRDNFNSIDAYLKDSKQRLQRLKKNMTANQLKMASMEETIQKLQQTVEEKQHYIDELKSNIDDLNVRVKQVTNELEEKNQVIEGQTQMLNTAYYLNF